MQKLLSYSFSLLLACGLNLAALILIVPLLEQRLTPPPEVTEPLLELSLVEMAQAITSDDLAGEALGEERDTPAQAVPVIPTEEEPHEERPEVTEEPEPADTPEVEPPPVEDAPAPPPTPVEIAPHTQQVPAEPPPITTPEPETPPVATPHPPVEPETSPAPTERAVRETTPSAPRHAVTPAPAAPTPPSPAPADTPAARAGGEGAGATGHLDGPPSLERPLRPVYPLGSRKRAEQGSVLLKAYVTSQGRVTKVEILEPSPYKDLNLAAQQALRRARFKPALRGDHPIASTIELRIDFRLSEQ